MRMINQREAAAIHDSLLGWREQYEYFGNDEQTKAFQELERGLSGSGSVPLTDSAAFLIFYALYEMSEQYGESVNYYSNRYGRYFRTIVFRY
jgi:hypothetical protein